MSAEPAEGTPLWSMDQACHEPFRQAWPEMEQRFNDGLYAPLRTGLEAHRALVESLGLEGDCPPATDDRTELLLGYRRLVVSDLLEPFVTFLKTVPTARLIEHVVGAVAESTTRANALATSVVTTWPEGALAWHPMDSLGRRLGKRLARGVSAARKAGAERETACRSIALAHLANAVAPTEDRAAVGVATDWANWSRQMAVAWATWGDTALPALVKLERMDDEDSSSEWDTVRASALTLDAELKSLLDATPTASAVAHAATRLTGLSEHLESDYGLAGSFLLRSDPGNGPAEAKLAHSSRIRDALESWDHGVRARGELYVALLAVMAGANGVQTRLVSRFREQCLTPIRGLGAIADELDSHAARPGAHDRLEELKAETVPTLLQRVGLSVPLPEVVDGAVTEGADAMVEALLAVVRHAPVNLEMHGEGARPPSRAKPVETRPVGLQELARQAFDALRMERVRSAAAGLSNAVENVRENLAGLSEVFPFAAEAAEQELEKDEPGAKDRAQELVAEALGSLAESLRHEVASVEGALDASQAKLADEIGSGSLGLLDRVVAGRMQAQLLAVQSRAAELRAHLNETLSPPIDRATRRAAIVIRRVRRSLTRGLRKGTEMVGGATGEQSESSRAVKVLADAAALMNELPLVYQRLFTLDALTDPTLLAGRAAHLDSALARWRRWKSKDGVPIIVTGSHGTGITSFLNALCASIEEDGGGVVRVSLPERVVSESVLAGALAEALQLQATDRLSGLASTVFEAPRNSLPQVAAIDNLEHLFLRAPNGTDLIERLLTFMAETEPRLFWIGGITASAWQLVSAGEATAVAQVDQMELPPLDAAAIRDAVKLRHRRSGLPIRYEEPDSGRRLLHRKLKRARSPEERDELLETDFFEHLVRTSGGDLRLALFQWLQVADFGSGDGLKIRAVLKPNFSVLELLTLTQNFTLKAFLEHRTLSLAEHDEIFRLPRQESYQIFESLGNRHLISVVPSEAIPETEQSEVQVDLRYQVQPLLTGAVTSHLQGRNIVH